MPDEFDHELPVAGEVQEPAAGDDGVDPVAEGDPATGPEDAEPADPEPVPEPVETPEEAEARIAHTLYPYPRDGQYHPWSFLFFNMPHLTIRDIDACHRMATWVFDTLGCGGPGTVADPSVKYDALGSSGAPWEEGRWIPAARERSPVQVTTPDTDLTQMGEEELAEYIANAQAALVAKRAGTAKEG